MSNTMTTFLHQRKRSEASLSDEYETPDIIVKKLSKLYNIKPEMDVACNDENCKTPYRLPRGDSLLYQWSNAYKSDVWCNPPHSLTKEFVLKADDVWKKENLNIMMIIPANSITTKYFEKVIDNVEIHPIFGRITFLVDKKPSSYPARNGYFCVIWRKTY